MTNSLPNRKHPAHPPPVYLHNRPIILFVTVCAKERRSIFDNPMIHDSLVSLWSGSKYWIVGYYLIMPDHLHLFCAPRSVDAESVVKWVGYWKHQLSARCRELKLQWLQNCWDTQMRSQEMYLKKSEYVRENPVRAGLVESAEMWPYQGVLSDLAWITA
jgi:putative transposase